MTTFNTSPDAAKEEVTIQLQIPLQHVGETISWLVEKSIPFGVHFLQTHLATQPKISNKAQSFLPSEEKTIKRASKIKTAQKTLKRRISDVFDNYITNGLTQLPPTQEEMAAELKISVSALKSQFKALYDKTFYQVYMDKRMAHAAQLLKQGYKAVEVSKRVGYGEKSVIKFNKMFQKHFGVTPKRYQMNSK